MKDIRANLFVVLFIAVPIVIAAWAVQNELAINAREQTKHTLTTVRDTTHQAIKTWFKDQKAAAMAWADNPKIRQSAEELLELTPHQSTLLASPAQQALRTWYQRIQNATHYQGYFVVGPEHINLASSRDQNVGVKNLLVKQGDFLDTIWQGRSAISLPTESDVPLIDKHGHFSSHSYSMFVAAPIHNDTGDVIAIFMFRLDLNEGFTSILNQGRIGNSGETYAFDRDGRLISLSRFENKLHDIGLIPEGEHEILNIQIRDPGVNLFEGETTSVSWEQQPLTFMVESAIRGETGINLDGYRDYRGVPVVGAWVWDPELSLGIATEYDKQEAYETLHATQMAILVLTAFTVFLLLGVTIIYTLYRQRRQTEAALRRAATVFDNTDEGIIVTNDKVEIILVNKAFTTITGYTAEEVIGKNPRFQQSGRHDIAFFRSMWEILLKNSQWRGEIWNRRKNGEIYPAWENINIVKDHQGKTTNYVAIFSDISILKASEARLARLAHYDMLTGLPNRLRFVANLEQAIETAKRHKQMVALMFMDLDRFKYINDTLGHNAGDELLKVIARRLEECVRAEDTVARLGGDEFMVVLTEVTRAEDAGLIADKIIHAICEPVDLGNDVVETSASIGISIYPDDATDSEDMVKAADTAMYHAKALGKNRFQFFTAELASRTIEHARIEKDLRKAIENNEFELCYQPQVNLSSGTISGVEALIRWNRPNHGQISPARFIPVADESELIDSITEWVIHTALRDYKAWSNTKACKPRIAVNITGRQLTRERSIKHILEILMKLSPEPDTLQLDLEITETALGDTERTINYINILKQHGVMFAIDDFGTGHSSLSRLKQLPVDYLKIDRSFISNISDNDDDKAIAAAIIAMAHTLNLRVIGEGVETRSQLDVLRELGCDEVQGFYFSGPVSASEITQLLDKTHLISGNRPV